MPISVTTRAARPGSALFASLAVIISLGVCAAVGLSVRADQPPAGALPAGAPDAMTRLTSSPRHGEWVTITQGADTVRAWVVYPERKTKAPVVVVIHEIFGLTNWIRGVADQLAADGFIAIAPDLMTGKISQATPDSAPQLATATIRTLKPEDVQRQISLVGDYGMKLPAAARKYGVVGFCWGGSTVFNHAVAAPGLGASVVYYGTSPATPSLAAIKAPVLGLYGENDARVNATIPAADSAMKALNKTYETKVFAGAGHGFLRQQDGQNGANLSATREAWPMTLAFFRKHLGS
ncbi:MAG: dienelactone hydrolase family protein [Gemmatimonadaceae bacterium]|jgi:carboxymethylenebutenolidase|nr:dienelactone hydrolase family protein [Gemmatimonadaceae bacterium]